MSQDALLNIPMETRMDAEKILFALELEHDGSNTTTRELASSVLGGTHGDDTWYLFDLDTAIRILAENHGLLLDGSHHAGMSEGLPFSLDYYVWHRKNAAANGKFDDEASPEGRDWRDEHDEAIANAIAEILSGALPAHIIPSRLRFSYGDAYALDAEILEVSCLFDTAGLSFSLGFELNTGKGGFRSFFEPEPEPSVMGVELSCESRDEGFKAAWNPKIGEWDKPLPLDAPQPASDEE